MNVQKKSYIRNAKQTRIQKMPLLQYRARTRPRGNHSYASLCDSQTLLTKVTLHDFDFCPAPLLVRKISTNRRREVEVENSLHLQQVAKWLQATWATLLKGFRVLYKNPTDKHFFESISMDEATLLLG